jgi:hypothetical protein
MFRSRWAGFLFRMLLVSVIVLVGFQGALRLLFPVHYRPLLQQYGHRYNVDPLLLAAVIRAESKFFPPGQVGGRRAGANANCSGDRSLGSC